MEKPLKTDRLLQTDGRPSIEKPSESSKVHDSEIQILRICRTISHSPNYDPSFTINAIKGYKANGKYLNRILYSQISTYVFSLSDEKIANFSSNVSHLLQYTIQKHSGDDELIDAVSRIYDHAELAICQKNMLSSEELVLAQKDLKEDISSIDASLKTIKTEYEESIKNTLRDYITIFGVFSAIIITFVGGISFTASVLESMVSVSIFRLVFVICLLGFVLFNSLYILLFVILKVSKIHIDKNVRIFGKEVSILLFVNICLYTTMFFDLLLYFIHAEQIRSYIDWLPW